MIYSHATITKNIEESCDVCVVGSGAGGSVMAKELSEMGLSVILLEEGGYYKTEDFRNNDTIESLTKLYRNGGSTLLLGKPNIIVGEGRCVGGSTTVNGGMCWRTPSKILKRWQWEKGLADMTPQGMEPFFKRVEETLSVSPVIPEATNRDAELLRLGAERLGYKVKANLRNQRACVGTNHCVMGCPTGGKQMPLITYIPAFLKRGGRLFTNCRVEEVRVKGSKVRGIKGVIIDPTTKKKTHRIKIHSKVVVVCGGAIQTPLLLKRSRIHDPAHLIGRNLFVHPNTKVAGVFEDRVEAWKGVNQAYQVTEFMDEGILMGVNFVPPGIMSLAFPFYGGSYLGMMRDTFHNCVLGAALIEDTTKGRVWNVLGQPVVTYNLNKRDFELSLRATALLAEIYFAAGAKRVFLPFSQLHEINTIDEIRKIYEIPFKPSDLELMTVHIMGTCQMGANPLSSVVNTHGESHQVKGLFVADASLFPTSIGVNPQETIMALATRNAFHIGENMSEYFR